LFSILMWLVVADDVWLARTTSHAPGLEACGLSEPHDLCRWRIEYRISVGSSIASTCAARRPAPTDTNVFRHLDRSEYGCVCFGKRIRDSPDSKESIHLSSVWSEQLAVPIERTVRGAVFATLARLQYRKLRTTRNHTRILAKFRSLRHEDQCTVLIMLADKSI
jgi:hypothetical protein